MSHPLPTDHNGNPIDLTAVLAAHQRWRETEGREGARANLAGAYLARAYLARANLARANLEGAYLARANLAGANLASANLAGANLAGANLEDAYLAGANLEDAYLARANLADANLAGAYLARANLADANLEDANLADANGIIILTETEHGYRVIAAQRAGEWHIYAGCRDFAISEARTHWGAEDYHKPLSGRRIVACLDWLEKEISNGLTLGGATR